MKSDNLLVDISHGDSYAPCMAYYRIRNEREHRRAMDHIAENGGHVPSDEYGRDDNILINDEDAVDIIGSNRSRRLAEWRGGWNVSILLDRWEAFAYYGYDCSEIAYGNKKEEKNV